VSGKGKSQLNGFLDGGSHLEGKLRFEDTFRVEGRITGAVESQGSLFVGERGEIRGEVRVRQLFVSGFVDAVIEATERVEVAAGGRLHGEVTAPCLVIEEGAIFQGQSKMVDHEAQPPDARAISPIRR
jgi:cytoskeletal protein CcmA (bactofilin family)